MKKVKYVNALIVSSLLSLAVFNNRTGQYIIIGLVALWAMANLISFLFSLPKPLKVKKVKAIEVPQTKAGNETEQLAVYEKAILLHFNCRITDTLKTTYPGVSWQWQIKDPVQFALKGGIGRIKLFNAGDYSYSEIKLDQFGRMEFSMIKVAALEEKAAEAPEDTAGKPDEAKTDVAGWFEGVGGDVLNELITEFNTQGHTKLLVAESGDVFLYLDGKKTQPAKKKLPDFPGKESWNELIKVLKAEELKATPKENQLLISWN